MASGKSLGERPANFTGPRRREEAGLPGRKFSFKVADLVLVKWNDGMVYFAKIKKIDHARSKCIVVFDDKSQDEASFAQIHSVDETTTDIICIKCKKDDSESPNEIVLCDSCGIGFHRRCHAPPIPSSALQLDMPWQCTYCLKNSKCPYLTESLDVLQNLLSDDEQAQEADHDQESVTLESDHFDGTCEDVIGKGNTLRKRKGRKYGLRRERKRIAKAATPEKPPPLVQNTEAKHRHASVELQSEHNGGDSVEDFSSHSPISRDISPEASPQRRKRLLDETGAAQKRLKRPSVESHTVSVKRRPSVESHTVSVKRVLVPVCEPNLVSSAVSHDSMFNSDTQPSQPNPSQPLTTIMEDEGAESQPRSLRVSLSLPEDMEVHSPLVRKASLADAAMLKRKVSQLIDSPPSGSTVHALPAWDDIAVSASSKEPARDTSESPVLLPSKPFAPLTAANTADIGSSLTGTQRTVSVERKRKLSLGDADAPESAAKAPKKEGTTISVSPSPPLSLNLSDEVFEVSPLLKKSPTQRTDTASPVASKAKITLGSPVQQARDKVNKSVITPEAVRPAVDATKLVDCMSKPSPAVSLHTTPRGKPLPNMTASPLPNYTTTRLTTTTSVIATSSTKNSDRTAVQLSSKKPPSTSVSTHVSAELSAHKQRPTTLQTKVMHSVTQPPSASPGSTPIMAQASLHGRVPIIQHARQRAAPASNPSPTKVQAKKTELPTIKTPLTVTDVVAAATSSSKVVSVLCTTLTPSAAETSPPRSTHALKQSSNSEETDDIIMTGYEPRSQKWPLQPTPVRVQTPLTAVQTDVFKHESRAKKVSAKTVEIQQATKPPTKPTSRPQPVTQTGAGSIIKPIASQTPVTVVPYVVTPTAFTPTATDGAPATYLIPAVGNQPAQQVYTVQPRGGVPVQHDSQQHVHYIIKDRSSPSLSKDLFRQSPSGGTPLSPVLSHVSVLPSPSHGGSYSSTVPPGYNMVAAPLIHATTAGQQQGSVVYYTSATLSQPPEVQPLPNAAAGTVSTKSRPCAVVSALPAYAHGPAGHHNHVAFQQTQPAKEPGTRGHHSSATTPVDRFQVLQHVASPIAQPVCLSTKSTPQQQVIRIQTPTVTPTVELEDITKKIETAFTTCSEGMLVSVFGEAMAKFHANKDKYHSLDDQHNVAVSTKPVHNGTPQSSHPSPNVEVVNRPPNAEVVSRPGSMPTVSLVRPSTGRARTNGPHRLQTPTTPIAQISTGLQQHTLPASQMHTPPSSKVKVVYTSAPQTQPAVGAHQYVYAYNASNSNQPILVQPGSDYAMYTIASPNNPIQTPGTQLKQLPSPQVAQHVQTAGLYYPEPPSAEPPLKRAESVVATSSRHQQQQQPIVISKPAVRSQQAAQALQPASTGHQSSRKSINPRRRAGFKSTRQCVLCGKEATYLCSGCHHVWYCGRECQLKAWEEHAEHCKA